MSRRPALLLMHFSTAGTTSGARSYSPVSSSGMVSIATGTRIKRKSSKTLILCAPFVLYMPGSETSFEKYLGRLKHSAGPKSRGGTGSAESAQIPHTGLKGMEKLSRVRVARGQRARRKPYRKQKKRGEEFLAAFYISGTDSGFIASTGCALHRLGECLLQPSLLA